MQHLMPILISYIVSVVVVSAVCVWVEMDWGIEEDTSGPFFVIGLVILSYLYLQMI